MLLEEALTGPKAEVSYVYDLSDHWEHQLVVEKAEPLAAAAPLPPIVCLAGRPVVPPKDIGGIPSYYLLLEALAEKAAGQRRRMPSEFAGLGKYDSDDAQLSLYKRKPSATASYHGQRKRAAGRLPGSGCPAAPPGALTGSDILALLRAQAQPPALPE